jgi:hypothetical protein
VLGNKTEKIVVIIRTNGIDHKYSFLPVPAYKIIAKYTVNLTIAFKALGTSISFVGTNF